MSKYTNHKHQWECYHQGSPASMECLVCHLNVMAFSDHVALWDMTGLVGNLLGRLNYPPDPEDEEATELEPEEVTADAEGGKEV